MLLRQIHLILVFILLDPVNIFRLWWLKGNPLLMDPNSICRKTRRLGLRQAELCQSQPEIVHEVAKGARLAIRECQHQLRLHHWNCTSQRKSLGKILQQDIRETAFVNAITAAGVVHAVTQACSQGELLQCGCVTAHGSPADALALERHGQVPKTQDGRWEWGGCGDDVDFGYEKSRQFVDSRRRRGKSDIRTLIDLHNNEAGRLVVKNNMRMECKCHGLSGSCSLRSCWRKMPLFREVGNHLMQSFRTAVRVMGGNDGKSLIPVGDDITPLDASSLIYSAESPDFCLANRRAGSDGTRGRLCSSSETGPGSCQSLCCGRGHADQTLEYEDNCTCQFHWCCVVQCQRCTVKKNVSICL
ncbi:protein Wnt-6 [Chanos chanos]|uniref:Protein Wnt n=1 Tax=Chanos chanos TaxID=29144 RepID=A0A6J2W0I7_CHACN|nr:protein Wnt-6-like [Chanos chanos]